MMRGDRMPAVFLDRDGVICENRSDYVRSWAEFTFIPGAVEAIASLSRSRTRIFITTNQSVVGRGLISRRQLDQIHDKMLDIINGSGGRIEAILVCPHHPDDRCDCRKPEPGLFLQAADKYKIDLKRSFMVGDAGSDMIAAARAGVRTVLVRTGLGSETLKGKTFGGETPEFVADDLVDAAIWILGQQALDFGMRAEARLR